MVAELLVDTRNDLGNYWQAYLVDFLSLNRCLALVLTVLVNLNIASLLRSFHLSLLATLILILPLCTFLVELPFHRLVSYRTAKFVKPMAHS